MAHDKCICSETWGSKNEEMCAIGERQVEQCKTIKTGWEKQKQRELDVGREVMQRLSQFTSALLPADDTPQSPSPVQPLQMSLMPLSNWQTHTVTRQGQTDKHEERAQMLHESTAHKWHDTTKKNTIIRYREQKKTRPQEQHGGQLEWMDEGG